MKHEVIHIYNTNAIRQNLNNFHSAVSVPNLAELSTSLRLGTPLPMAMHVRNIESSILMPITLGTSLEMYLYK